MMNGGERRKKEEGGRREDDDMNDMIGALSNEDEYN